MRVVHISDPHLGYRAYNRVTPAGINVREADVFNAFRAALRRTAEIAPDLIVIAGDLFHVVRPSNLTIQHTFREFLSLRQKSNAPIVIIGGNHDSPRSVDTGCILDLYAHLPGVYVAHTEYVQIPLKDLDTSVFCLCHRALPQLSSLKIEPDPSSKYNVLVAHGTVEGIVRNAYDLVEISRSQVLSDGWDYIAFGHYHVFEKLADNAYYSGSLEYTSTSIWGEASQPKGFVEYDLDQRSLLQFHEIETREVIDLRPIDASGITAAELDRAIEQRIMAIKGGWKNKIIRLVVQNVPRSVQADLDYAAIRRIRSEALHFELQLRPPQVVRRDDHLLRDAGPARPLEAEWEEFAKTCQIAPGIDREHLAALGREYLLKQAAAE
ncbi:MAG: exonuclease SbcCD subunit D [Armatimonadota bacterium]|nr:exonuclease SbcCD subunit D [Armatimonadota bacterium]